MSETAVFVRKMGCFDGSRFYSSAFWGRSFFLFVFFILAMEVPGASTATQPFGSGCAGSWMFFVFRVLPHGHYFSKILRKNAD